LLLELAVLLVVSLADAKFIRSGDIVVDSISLLEWQDNATPVKKSWKDAIDYCENLSLSGNNDWRLPNINELLSIVDDSKYNPAINSAFLNFTSSRYWSSTAFIYYSFTAWYVNFNYGSSDSYSNKTNEFYIRCVRAGQ